MDVDGERFDEAARGAQAGPRRRRGHGPRRGRPARARRRVQDDRPRGRRPRLPDRPVRAARPRDQGRVRVAGSASAPATTANSQKIAARPGHRRQRRDDGLRQHGRRLGDRRRVHPRPEHRREGALRRVPDERPGRGRRRRHPDGPRRSARWQTEMPEVYAEFQRIGERLETPLPRRPGPRVHDRARPALHAPDPLGQADRRGRREDRGRHGRRGRHHEGGGGRADRAGTRRPAAARPVRPDALAKARRGSPRASTRRRAPPSARPCSTPTTPSSGSSAARRSSSSGSRRRRTTSMAWPSPRASSPRAAVRRRTPPSSPARSASRASPGSPELHVDYAASKHRDGHRDRVQGGRLGQPRRLDRRGLRRRAADGRGALRGPARAPEDPRLGRRVPPAWRSGRTPTSPRRPPRPGATVPRASASAGPSTCSARASGWTSSADAILVAFTGDAGQGARTLGEPLAADERAAIERFDAAMGKLEVLQQGDFEGIFRAMDGLPVVIRLIDPPLHEFLPNLEEQLVKVATRRRRRGGRPDRGARVLLRADGSSRCASRTRCSGCAAAASG